MDYRITCVCGHPFVVSDETLRSLNGGTINCPSCNQRLSPAIEIPMPRPAEVPAPPAGTPVASAHEPTKRCPFCGEVILAIARKCRHCGEFLDRPASPPPGRAAFAPGPSNDVDPANAPVFALSVSQWDNFWRFFTIIFLFAAATAAFLYVPQLQSYAPAGLPCALALAILAATYFYLRTKYTRITVRPVRLEVETGIFNKHLTSLELFRVNDISLQQGLIPRILGFGTIKLTTNDADTPELLLSQIPRAREIRQYLHKQIPLAARHGGAVYMEK